MKFEKIDITKEAIQAIIENRADSKISRKSAVALYNNIKNRKPFSKPGEIVREARREAENLFPQPNPEKRRAQDHLVREAMRFCLRHVLPPMPK